MFIRFDRMYERNRQTDRQTPHDDISRAAKNSSDDFMDTVATYCYTFSLELLVEGTVGWLLLKVKVWTLVIAPLT